MDIMIFGFGTADHVPGHRFHREAGFAHWTLAVMWRGEGRVVCTRARASLGQGDVAIVRPRTPYAFESPRGCTETWILLDPPPTWESALAWPEQMPGVSVIPAASPRMPAAQAAVREAEGWWIGGSPQRHALTMNALERCLLLLALDRVGTAWAGLHPAVRAAVEYLAPGPGDPITVAGLARRVGTSASHLAHRFTAEIGESPLSWLESRRLARAQHLLLVTDWPVKRVAAACGFADGEHLARRFRARLGTSPGGWRRAQGA